MTSWSVLQVNPDRQERVTVCPSLSGELQLAAVPLHSERPSTGHARLELGVDWCAGACFDGVQRADFPRAISAGKWVARFRSTTELVRG